MNFSLKAWTELTRDELYAALALRARVFVVEQDCPYNDVDGADPKAFHLLGTNGGGALVAYARIFAPGIKYTECAIGRVVTAPEIRRGGAGRAVFAEAMAHVDRMWGGGAGEEGAAAIRIQAQSYVERFYAGFGFVRATEEYLEDGIAHVDMVRVGRGPR